MVHKMQSPAMTPYEGDSQFPPPDFRHVRNWIFDLDNTLYRADNGIFAQIESRMTDYIVALLNLPRCEAYLHQKQLYWRYGTTLNGLMCEHGIDAEDYLRFVHDIDLSILAPDPLLAAMIEKLPGRHFVFTNGCCNHACRILDRLGMKELFDGIWDIRTMGFAPKPQDSAYERVVAASLVEPRQSAMFDDIARNLAPAHALGMTTVWIKTDFVWAQQRPTVDISSSDIDHNTDNLIQFLQTIRI